VSIAKPKYMSSQLVYVKFSVINHFLCCHKN